MNLRKILSMTLVFLLVFASASMAMAAPNKSITRLKEVNRIKPVLGKRLLDNPKTEGLDDSSIVRIIVELNDKPVIEYATQQGVKFNKLDAATVERVTDEILSAQKLVKDEITAKNINVEYHNEFTNVVNGFSATTTLGEAKEIEKLSNIKSVVIANEYDRPEPEMNTSLDIIKATETWAQLGYDGEGMVVSVIDTGIDPNHKDMVLTTTGDLSPIEIETIIDNESLPGKWFTEKVPYGYNYMDNNQEILDLGPDASMHGMHVAGTVGANGDENGIKGVAPEAQLLAMKVFGNDPGMPSTFGDVIIRAIDDSIVLGADVINMSLGSTASFVMPEDPEQMAVTRAVENGVFCAISAGNSDRFGSGWGDPYSKDPDVGVVGSPGLTSESLQVASIENTHIKAYALDANEQLMGYVSAGPDEVAAFDGPVGYVYCGLGGEQADFDGKDLTGKIALIKRGGFAFVTKILNAENNGAVGVIVFNDEDRGDALVNMAYPTVEEDGQAGTIPAVFIGNTDGTTLLSLIDDEIADNEVVEFNGKETTVLNPDSGKMSDFTSWGTTPSLDFKPEITAPGGRIYSTLNNDEYGMMSGTSMASPHVAGGAALVLQKVEELFPTLEGSAKIEMAKNLLMSTAIPVAERFELTSPRRQGAGVMDLFGATSTPTIITHKDTGLSKVSLKEIGDVTTFTLEVQNFSDEEISYKALGNVSTDLIYKGDNWGEPEPIVNVVPELDENGDPVLDEDGEVVLIETVPMTIALADGTVVDNETTFITVPANGSVEFEVTVDLSEAVDWFYWAPLQAVYPNGNFVDGFITLVDSTDTNPSLSIPYVGFYGEWDQAPIIDDSNYDEDGMPFYGYTTMMDEETYFLGQVGEDEFNGDKVAFSPNGDDTREAVQPLLSFLRNAKEIDINILDGNHEKIRDLYNGEDIRKNYHDGRYPVYTYRDEWIWDGTAKNELVEDGQYYYEIKAKIDFAGAEWQTFEFPVKVDTVAPAIDDITFDAEAKTLTVVGSDDFSTVDQAVILDSNFDLIDVTSDGIFDLSEFDKGDYNVFVVVTDFASNMAFTPYSFTMPSEEPDEDDTIPYIFMDSPEAFGTYNTNEIEAFGGIADASDIVELKINEEDVDFDYNPETGMYEFETILNYENGMQLIDVTAKDSKGNEINFERKIFVDSEAPVIGVPDASGIVENDVDSINIAGTISDNFPDLKVIVDGNMITNISEDWAYFTDLDPASYDLNMDIPLNEGANTIVIEAIDAAGNSTVSVIDVYRLQVGEGDFEITYVELDGYELVSSDRPLEFYVEADVDVDWEVQIINPDGDVEETLTGQGTEFDGTWAPLQSKKLNGEYKLVVNATKDGFTETEEHTFEVYNYPVKIQEVDVINQDGYVAVEATIENLGPNPQNPMLIVKVTDSEGYVVNISTVRMDNLLEGQTISLSSGFGLNTPGEYNVDVFVWTGWENTQILSSQEATTFTVE